MSAPKSGTITDLNKDTGSLVYTPGDGFTGQDRFTFKASDGTTDSNTAPVTVTVSQVLSPPVAESQSVLQPLASQHTYRSRPQTLTARPHLRDSVGSKVRDDNRPHKDPAPGLHARYGFTDRDIFNSRPARDHRQQHTLSRSMHHRSE